MRRLSLLLLVWLLVRDTASAGAYLPRSGTAESTRQRAVLMLEGTTTTLMIQSNFAGTANELAWVVPVASIGAAREVGSGPADAFLRLHEETAPRLVRLVEKRTEFGCTNEGVTFVTKTELETWTGLGASDITHHALDGPTSSQIVAWLAGEPVTNVCPDRATFCTTDEDCGQVAVCELDGGCYAGSDVPSGCCTNQAVTCVDDGDCGGEIECFQRMCVRLAPACGDDTDCGARVACAPSGFCRYLTPTCSRDEDCGGVTEENLCLPRVCSGDTSVSCSDTAACETQSLGTCLLRCPDGETACTDDQECGPQECVPGICGDGTSCSHDSHCGGIRECDGGTCVDGGADCVVDEDCGGVTECTRHCSNLRVPCSSEVDCNYECRLGHCQQRPEDLCLARDCEAGESCTFTCPDGTVCASHDQCVHVTQVSCGSDARCSAAEECQSFTIGSSSVSLCANQVPFCSSNADCNVSCVEDPAASGGKVCAGTSIPCTDGDGDGLDSACDAPVECQHNTCLNLTPPCTTELECATTCVDDRCGGIGMACQNDGDCAAVHDCASRAKLGESYPLSSEQLAWLNRYTDDGSNFVVTELAGVSPASEAEVLPPLVFQLGGDVRSFPLRPVAGTVELELWVIAPKRYRPANYPSVELVIDPVFDGTDFDAWYRERVEEKLAGAGGPVFLVEHADRIALSVVESVLGRRPAAVPIGTREWFVTKLRGRINATDASQDLELVSTGSTEPFLIRTVGRSATSSQASAPAGGLAILLGAVLLFRSSRRRR